MAQQTLNLPREQTHQRIADALEDIVDKIVDTSSADNIDYDNTTSGLSANKVQSAIDELALAGFVTNTVNNLVNYYLKSETYNKTEVDSLINAVKNSRFEAVSTLPTTNIKTNVIYLVPKSPTQTNNAKDEYINLDGTSSGWEKIGDTEVDLSGYVTTTALNTALSNYTTTANLTKLLDDKVDKVSGKGLSTNDYTDTEKQKLSGIEAGANKTVVDSAMSDSSTNPLQNKVITKELEGAKTATGNPITVTDAAPVNAVNLSMDLEPVQDLHGYDHPWVGGAGKNKLSMTVDEIKSANASGTWNGNVYTLDGVTFTLNTDSDNNILSINAKGSHNSGYVILRMPNFVLKPETYTLSQTGGNIGNDAYIELFRDSIGTVAWARNGYSETFTSSEDFNVYGRLVLHNFSSTSGFTYYPMLRLATETDSSFAPYENICPISGRSEVAIERVGKNLAKEIINGYIDSTARKFYTDAGETILFYAIKGKTYKVSSNKTINRGAVAFINTTNIYNNMPVDDLIYIGNNTTSWTATWSGWSLWYITNETWSETETNTQLELGSTATTYEPYAGKTYTIQLGDTIYGGELDVVTGKLRVTHELWTKNTSTMNNTENYPGWIDCGIKELVGNGFDILIENQIMNIGTDYGVNTQAQYDILYLPRDTYGKTQTEWKALAQDIEIAVELATPYTIQLTPQQIKMLENTNTIYTDYEGDTITIEYQPNNAIGEAVRVVEESYDAIIQNLLERIEALENNE